MTEAEAIALIENVDIDSGKPQQWADLGCGSGLFSFAIASLLPAGSSILCVDKTNQHFPESTKNDVKLEFLQADFMKETLPVENLDGFLMANSLHFVKEKAIFIKHIKSFMADDGQFIIVEYDTDRANPWIPYPISFADLKELFGNSGFHHITKIGERPSRFGRKKMVAYQIS